MIAAEALFPGAPKTPRPFELVFRTYREREWLDEGGVSVKPYEVSHPSGAPPYALRFDIDGKVLTFSGDTEWVESLGDAARGADLFITECYAFERPARYHLNWTTLKAQLPAIHARRVLLTHMGPEMLANQHQITEVRRSDRQRRLETDGLTTPIEAEPSHAAALDRLLAEIRACRVCCTKPRGAPLAHEPRPVLRVSATARILVVGQAPGTKVHASGKPFDDRSGVRLRAWMGVPADVFYDETRIAIAPMGFCFPGQDAKGGDCHRARSARRSGARA